MQSITSFFIDIVHMDDGIAFLITLAGSLFFLSAIAYDKLKHR